MTGGRGGQRHRRRVLILVRHTDMDVGTIACKDEVQRRVGVTHTVADEFRHKQQCGLFGGGQPPLFQGMAHQQARPRRSPALEESSLKPHVTVPPTWVCYPHCFPIARCARRNHSINGEYPSGSAGNAIGAGNEPLGRSVQVRPKRDDRPHPMGGRPTTVSRRRCTSE